MTTFTKEDRQAVEIDQLKSLLLMQTNANIDLVKKLYCAIEALESIVEMNPELPMGMIEAAQSAIAKTRGEHE